MRFVSFSTEPVQTACRKCDFTNVAISQMRVLEFGCSLLRADHGEHCWLPTGRVFLNGVFVAPPFGTPGWKRSRTPRKVVHNWGERTMRTMLSVGRALECLRCRSNRRMRTLQVLNNASYLRCYGYTWLDYGFNWWQRAVYRWYIYQASANKSLLYSLLFIHFSLTCLSATRRIVIYQWYFLFMGPDRRVVIFYRRHRA